MAHTTMQVQLQPAEGGDFDYLFDTQTESVT